MQQLSISIILVTSTLYLIDNFKGSFLLLYVVNFSFGLLRLRSKQFLTIALFIILSYSISIILMFFIQPERLNFKFELVNLSLLFIVFTWFSILGGYINKLKKKVDRLATKDELTSFYNRRYIFSLLKKEIEISKRRGHVCSIIMIDIDDFKKINDTFGHQAGDFVLKKVAEKIRSSLRKYDSIGRYGGEEFLLIITDPSIKESKTCAERIRATVNEMKIKFKDTLINVSISIGITDYKDPELIDETLARADKALYEAKNAGKNTVKFL